MAAAAKNYKGFPKEALIQAAEEMNMVMGFEKEGNPIDTSQSPAKLYKEIVDAGTQDPDAPDETGLTLTDDFSDEAWETLEKMGLKPEPKEEAPPPSKPTKAQKAAAAKKAKAAAAKEKAAEAKKTKAAKAKAAAEAKANKPPRVSRLTVMNKIVHGGKLLTEEEIGEAMLEQHPGKGLASSTVFETMAYLRVLRTCQFAKVDEKGKVHFADPVA